jgi:hypothetical protein
MIKEDQNKMEESNISQAEQSSDKSIGLLEKQIATECVAMASYAFRSGLKGACVGDAGTG